MSGNVSEWCADYYAYNYCDCAGVSGVTGVPECKTPEDYVYRVNRGGSWDDFKHYCEVTDRDSWPPDYHYQDVGFRVVLP
jgi:formylglycine-generating enzyme required for sulfatase activity